MKLGFILTVSIFLFAPSGFAQSANDSVTVQGIVSDFEGNPVDSCSVMWKNSSFGNVVEVLTDSLGHYSARVPKGKYRSMAAVRMDRYPHTASKAVSDKEQRLEFWAWDFIADRDTVVDIRYHRLEAYGLHAFEIVGGAPTYQIYVRPMSLTRFQKISRGEQAQTGGMLLAPSPARLNVDVWIDGEKVGVIAKQEIREYLSTENYINACLLTVSRPKQPGHSPYRIFRVELEDLDTGDRGEGLYYMEKESYSE